MIQCIHTKQAENEKKNPIQKDHSPRKGVQQIFSAQKSTGLTKHTLSLFRSHSIV